MIASFIAALRETGLDPTAEEVADVFWLALHANQAQTPADGTAVGAGTGPEPPRDLEAEAYPSVPEQERLPLEGEEETEQVASGPASTQEVSADGRVYTWPSREASTTRGSGIPFRSPGARALPGALELSRALRPLMRRAASRTERVFDEEGTINRVAEEGIWFPVLRPAQTRWLEVALVIDDGASMSVWKQPVREFKRLLELLGAFRDVRAWRLDTDFIGGPPPLHAGDSEVVRSPTELIDPTGRRIIIIVTDCVSPAWEGEHLPRMLAEWGIHHPLAILQMLPQKLWSQTSLYAARPVRVRPSRPAQPNSELFKEEGRRWPGRKPSKGVPIPIFTLEPTPAAIWSRLVSGSGGVQSPAFMLPSGTAHLPERLALIDSDALTPSERLEMFRAKVSSTAYELARLLAAAPLTLPVMRLIQGVMLPQSRQEHLAEVFLGGILRRLECGDEKCDPDDIRYDFLPGVRDLLLNSAQVPDSVVVIKIVSKYLEKRLGQSLDFAAILANPSAVGGFAVDQGNQEFARIGAAVLKRLGGRYARIAERLDASVENQAVADASGGTVTTLSGEGDTALRDTQPPGSAVNPAVAELIEEALLNSYSTLNLSSLGLTELPEDILVLTELRELDLSHNQLKKLPNKVGRLSGLERLNLSHNLLSKLPPSLGALRELEELHLTHNRLAAMPTWVARMGRLRHLCLNHNRLEKLPAWIDNLTGLEGLELSGNRLSSLPHSVGGLSKLKELRLDGNRLTDLPESLRRIPALERLYLHGNYALGLPAEILGENPDGVYLGLGRPANPEHILDYYFRVRGGERRPLNEAKLILVGRGAVGKTSVVNRLIHGTFEDVKKTEGVRITEWPLTVGEKKDPVRLNVWDFGGQEIMHATHQFFLTERSLYLLVLSGREGVEDADAEYWLKLIQSFGGDSPVIVVLNKIKEHPFDLNRNALLRKYPSIREFVKTDCEDATGIEELRRIVERETDKLEHLRDAFPASWFSIKDRLAGMKRDYLSFDEFRKVCAELGEPDPQAQESLAFHLHNLGIALNYKDDTRLKDTHVLNPHWVTSGIYKILNSYRLEKQKGEISLNDLPSILDEQQYPRAMHGFLLDLMKKFELCFNLEGRDDVYLIPELLDKQEPAEADEFDPAECLNFQYHYPVLPEGLLPRFIVRTHVLSEDAPRWRTGVILEFERNRALVKGDVQDEKIFISISGPASGRRRLLGLIRSEFAHIHRSIRRLNPQEMVPLPGRPDAFVPYEELAVLERQGVATFPKVIDGEVLELDVQALLNGVDLRDKQRRERARDESGVPARVFVSYSHRDERLRNRLEVHLKLLQREGLVETWQDRDIEAGEDWQREVDEHLERADIILMLVSPDFVASEYCYGPEMMRALQRHEAGQARVIPIILRHCLWKETPLGELQPLPHNGRPLIGWKNRDQAFMNVALGIKAVSETIQRSFLLAGSERGEDEGAIRPERDATGRMPFTDPERFVPPPGLIDAVNSALTLKIPLCLTGEPGVGKTSAAFHIASELGLEPPLVFQTSSTSTAEELFYQFNRIEYLRAQRSKRAPSAANFITFGPLGQAVLLSLRAEDAQRYLPEALQDKGPRRSVVLIDEIDRASRDMTASLLNALEEVAFAVPEVGLTFQADPAFTPVLILTAVSAGNLPPDLVSRCVLYQMPFPDKEQLHHIANGRLSIPSTSQEILKEAVNYFYQVRSLEQLQKKPLIADFLQWVELIVRRQINFREVDASQVAEVLESHAILAKTTDGKIAVDHFFYNEFSPRPTQRPLALPYFSVALLDRHDQEATFAEEYVSHRSLRPGRPFVCVIHGDEGEEHSAFISRLRDYSLPRLREGITANPPVEFILLLPPGGAKAKESLVDIFLPNLAVKVVDNIYASSTEVVTALSRYEDGVMISTPFVPAEEGTAGLEVLKQYLEFWNNLPNLRASAPLVICLSVIYRKAKGFFKGINVNRTNKLARNFLANLDWGKYEHLGGVVLPELTPVRHVDVEDWLHNQRQSFAPALKEKVSAEVRRLYTAKDVVPMEELTALLQRLLSEKGH